MNNNWMLNASAKTHIRHSFMIKKLSNLHLHSITTENHHISIFTETFMFYTKHFIQGGTMTQWKFSHIRVQFLVSKAKESRKFHTRLHSVIFPTQTIKKVSHRLPLDSLPTATESITLLTPKKIKAYQLTKHNHSSLYLDIQDILPQCVWLSSINISHSFMHLTHFLSASVHEFPTAPECQYLLKNFGLIRFSTHLLSVWRRLPHRVFWVCVSEADGEGGREGGRE